LNKAFQEVDKDNEFLYRVDDDVVHILDMGTMYNPFGDVGGLDMDFDSNELDYIQYDVQDHFDDYM
jgi:hypothetical protein